MIAYDVHMGLVLCCVYLITWNAVCLEIETIVGRCPFGI